MIFQLKHTGQKKDPIPKLVKDLFINNFVNKISSLFESKLLHFRLLAWDWHKEQVNLHHLFLRYSKPNHYQNKLLEANSNWPTQHILTNTAQVSLLVVWGPALLSHLGAYLAQKFSKCLRLWIIAFNFWVLIPICLDISFFFSLLNICLIPPSRFSPLLWALKLYICYLASDQTVIFLCRRATWLRWICPNQGPDSY